MAEDDNILEVGATINLSDLLPRLDEMAAATESATSSMSDSFAKVNTAATTAAEGMAAASGQVRAAQQDAGDFAEEFANRYRSATSKSIADAEEFAVTVSASTQKVAADLAEVAAVAKIQQRALTDAFRAQGEAAAMGVESATTAIGEQIAQLAVTRAEAAQLQKQLNRLAASEVEQAAAARTSSTAEKEQTTERVIATAVTKERAAAEQNLTASLNGGLSPRLAASESLQVLQGTMRGGSRAAAALITEVLGLGPAFAYAFPVIGAIAMVEILGRVSDALLNVLDKAHLTAIAVRKIAEESANLQIKSDDATRSLEAENLQLGDMMANLEGRPEPNKLAIALIEISNKADQLATQFQADFNKIGEAIDAETTKAARFKTALKDAFSLEGAKAAAIDFLVSGTPLGENLYEQGQKISAQRKEEQAALKQVQTATEGVAAARQKADDIENAMAVAKTDAERVALSHQLRIAYGEQATAVGQLNAALSEADLKAKAVKDTELAAKLSAGAKQAKSEIRDLALEITRVGLTVDEVQASQAKKLAATMSQLRTAQIKGGEKVSLIDIEGEKEAAAQALALAQENYRRQVELAVQTGKTRAQAEIDALPALKAAENDYTSAVADAERKAHEARVAALEAEIKLAKTSGAKRGDELRLQLQNLNDQLTEEDHNYQNTKAKLAADANRQITTDELREIQLRLNAQREALRQEVLLINQKVSAAKAAADASITSIRSGTPTTVGADDQIARINQLYSQGMISFREYRAEKIAALTAEKAKLEEVYATEQAALQQQFDKIAIDIQEGKFQGEALEAAQREYEKLRQRIQEVDTEQQRAVGNVQRGLHQAESEVSRYSLTWAQFLTQFKNQSGTVWDQFRNAGQQAFASVSRGFGQAVGQWMQQGGSFGLYLAQVWNRIVANFASALAEMLAQFVLHEAAKVVVTQASQAQQTAAVATGSAARADVGLIADLKSIGRAAAVGAAHAFKWVMMEVPFPANLALAPAAAAAAFAGILSFGALAGGKAEKGGLLSEDGPIFAHAKELVLPAPIATGFQNLVTAGGLNLPPALSQNFNSIGGASTSSHTTTTKHYHSTVSPKIAVSVQGTSDGMRDLHDTVVKTIKRALRNGQLGLENV